MPKWTLPTLFLAGLLAGCSPQPDRSAHDPGVIDMEHLVFATELREIAVGDRITFANSSSRALHVLVVGKDAQPKSQEGAPGFGGASGHRAEVGDLWTTPAWNVPGTYWVTCTLHPSMNLKVVVTQH